MTSTPPPAHYDVTCILSTWRFLLPERLTGNVA
jgi:hypothetical protein